MLLLLAALSALLSVGNGEFRDWFGLVAQLELAAASIDEVIEGG